MVTIDYSSIDKKGLKSLLDKFTKEALPVQEVVADNKQTRESGYPVKKAKLTFASGQVLELKFKATGDLYQAKLNGKVLAIKEYHKAETFTNEVIAYVKANEPAYAKQKEKQLARTKVVVPRVKTVSTSIAEQIQTFSTSLEELRGQKESLSTQIATLKPLIVEKDSSLLRLQAELETENNRSNELQTQLDALQSGIMESAYFPKAGTPEHVLQKAGYTMVQDEGRILGFRDFGKTGKMVPVSEYKQMPKEVLAAMKAVIQDDLDYEDEDGKHPFHLDAPIKHIFEAAGTAPAQLDRLQIANDMMHGDGRHPKLKAAFVEGFNNSCSMEDAITFIESFSDTELLTLLKDEENIFEGIALKAPGKIARLSRKEFLDYINAPEDAPILEAVEGFNAHQMLKQSPARAMILEDMGEVSADSPSGDVQAATDRRGTYAERTEPTGWNVFQDTTVIAPYSYPAPIAASLGSRGGCPLCGGEMEVDTESNTCTCTVCCTKTGMDGALLESAKPLKGGTAVTLKGHRAEGDALAGKEGVILESVPTAQGPFYKVKVGDMVYRGVAPGMILEGIGLEIDRSGTHDPSDPAHVDDPDHETYGDKAKSCPWCGSDVREEKCIQCNRQYPMAVQDRKAWEAANKPLPPNDFPSQYE